MINPRSPNPKEIDQLMALILLNTYPDGLMATAEERTNAQRLVESASVAVFDNYAADSPGYAGKLMSVIWPGGPDLYEAYIWRNGEITRVYQDEGLQSKEKGGVLTGDNSERTS